MTAAHYPAVTHNGVELVVEVEGVAVGEEAMLVKLREIELQQMVILQRANLATIGTGNRNRPAAQVPGPESIPPRQGFRLPEIPSWAYLLLFVGVSQFFGSKGD